MLQIQGAKDVGQTTHYRPLYLCFGFFALTWPLGVEYWTLPSSVLPLCASVP